MLYWVYFSSMVRHLDTRAVSTAGMRDLVQFKGYLYPKNTVLTILLDVVVPC